MRCRDVKWRVLAGEAIAEGEVADHLESCAPCAALLEEDRGVVRALASAESANEVVVGGHVSAATPPGFEALGQAVAAERGWAAWLRSLRTSTRLMVALVAVVAVALSGLALMRADLGVYPRLRMALEVGLLAALAVAAVWIWLRPLHRPPLPATLMTLVVGAALVLSLLLAWLPAAHMAHPASLAGRGDELVSRALACFLFGGLLALPVAALVRYLGRDDRPRLLRGLLAVGAGALAGLLALHLHCPITGREHLLLGHATMPLALALGYASLRAARAYARIRRCAHLGATR